MSNALSLKKCLKRLGKRNKKMNDKTWIRCKILGMILLCLFFIASFLYYDGEKFIQGCNLFCAISSMCFAYDYRKCELEEVEDE